MLELFFVAYHLWKQKAKRQLVHVNDADVKQRISDYPRQASYHFIRFSCSDGRRTRQDRPIFFLFSKTDLSLIKDAFFKRMSLKSNWQLAFPLESAKNKRH